MWLRIEYEDNATWVDTTKICNISIENLYGMSKPYTITITDMSGDTCDIVQYNTYEEANDFVRSFINYISNEHPDIEDTKIKVFLDGCNVKEKL